VPRDDLKQCDPAQPTAGGTGIVEGQELERSPVLGLWDHGWKSSSSCSIPDKTVSLQTGNFSSVESFQ